MLSFLVFCEMFLIDLCLLIIGKMQVGSSSVTRPLLDLFLWRLFRSIRLTLFFFFSFAFWDVNCFCEDLSFAVQRNESP